MSTQPDRSKNKSRIKRLLLAAGILALLPGLCCYLSYQIEDLNDFYFLIAGRHYYDLTMTKVPEFDQLNDELIAELPQYPGAVLIPGTEIRYGPGKDEFRFAPGPRSLDVCYMVDAPTSQVIDFYEQRLKQDGWKLEVKRWPLASTDWIFSKDKACVVISYGCTCVEYKIVPDLCPSAQHERETYPTAYEVEVYYNLNVLLGFPGVPDGGCP